jgi:dolichol kinase
MTRDRVALQKFQDDSYRQLHENNDSDITFKQEVLRKALHMVSLSIPVIYSFVTKEFALWILIPLTIILIIFDMISRKNNKFRYFFHKIFAGIMRPHEYNDVFTLNGATWMVLSALICVILFPKLFVVTGFTILIASDISSALIGKKYGKHPSFVNKTWEGTFAFWISAIIVVFILGLLLEAPWTYYVFGIIAAIVGGFAEATSAVMKMDDNLSVPVSIALVLWAGEIISTKYFMLSYIELL